MNKALREQIDVEAEVARAKVDLLFLRGQQIEQQRANARRLKRTRDELIARAVPAAAAAVREEDDAARAGGQTQLSFQSNVPGWNADVLGPSGRPRRPGRVHRTPPRP
jgi:hypothetical protein